MSEQKTTGIDSLLRDLGQAAFDTNIDEYERIESEIKKAFADSAAPQVGEDWEKNGKEEMAVRQLLNDIVDNAISGDENAVGMAQDHVIMALRRALRSFASRPTVDVDWQDVMEDLISDWVDDISAPYRNTPSPQEIYNLSHLVADRIAALTNNENQDA